MLAQKLIISGRVQGVGYRRWFAEQARMLGAAGYVRNLPDGRVEAVIAGTDVSTTLLMQAAERGPTYARVSEVELAGVIELDATTLSGFVIARG
ncbi:acylphosphatase [Polycladidibacter hongkongensis]|uniref:acylphosphatase n=1 Tax=Polycladidibacter hongkongensis TaxID=1647556 RepID=UPI000829798C|nr:acylphosphatase [Pseudovibrio hongkongensis]